MKVRMLFFAALADAIGARDMDVDLADGATVGDAINTVAAMRPDVAPMLTSVAGAVNEAYVPRTSELRDSDVLALIPPVSGG